MKSFGIAYDNVLNIVKQNNYTVSQALNTLKLNGYGTVDINYDLISDKGIHFSAIYQNGFTISSVIVTVNLTSELNVIYPLSVVDFCFHYNLKNIVIDLKDFSLNENSLFILKKNLRRIVRYANVFNIKISIKNTESANNLCCENLLLDVLKSVKGLTLNLDIVALYKVNKTPFCNEKTFSPYINKLYINDCKIVENTVEYTALFMGETDVLQNIKNFKKCDNVVDFTIYSICENCELEKILINSAINYVMEINYGQD